MLWIILIIVVLLLILFFFIIFSREYNYDNWIQMPFYRKLTSIGVDPPSYAYILADKVKAKYIAKQRCPSINVAKLIYVSGDYHFPDFNTILEKDRQYILKSNNASKRNVIIDINSHKNGLIREWLTKPYHTSNSTEKFYSQIKPMVLIEEKIDLSAEYRIFCFHGKAHYIKISGPNCVAYYTIDWKLTELRHFLCSRCNYIEKPKYLEDLIKISEQLSQDIAFVCIDLMVDKQDQIYFGEFTFCPNNSAQNLIPVEYQEIFSNLWKFRDY